MTKSIKNKKSVALKVWEENILEKIILKSALSIANIKTPTSGPSGIWHHEYLSTLVQPMACCLAGPNHYWLIINEFNEYITMCFLLETSLYFPCFFLNDIFEILTTKSVNMIFKSSAGYHWHEKLFDQEPLLLIWIYFNPRISNYIHHNVWNKNTYTFPNLNSCTVEICEWISYFIPHFTGHVIIHLCWD